MPTENMLAILEGNLILRRSTVDDAERLAEFNVRIHSEAPDEEAFLSSWTLDLLSGKHPTMGPDGFLIVEDPGAGGKIVSALCLIPQVWAYAGIPLGVGRPELVGTDPEYRNRGLVRRQMEVAHGWSAARGDLMQVITGIPYYYRQFGYEMTVALGGGRVGEQANLPLLKEGEPEPFGVRPARLEDAPLLAQMDADHRLSLLHSLRDAEIWRYEIAGKREDNRNRVRIVERGDGAPVGYFVLPPALWQGGLQSVITMDLSPTVSYQAALPTILRAVWADGLEAARRTNKELKSYGLWLGEEHPAYEALPSALPLKRKSYAYYVRTPDLPALMRRIAPALEERLAASPVMVGYSGELKINFYRGGLRLVFSEGRLQEAAAWTPTQRSDEGQAAFPALTFLHLVFGHRDIETLESLFADVRLNDEARAALSVLFPRQSSLVWSIS